MSESSEASSLDPSASRVAIEAEAHLKIRLQAMSSFCLRSNSWSGLNLRRFLSGQPGQLLRGSDLLTWSVSIPPVVSQTAAVFKCFHNTLGNPHAFSQHPSSMASDLYSMTANCFQRNMKYIASSICLNLVLL